MVKLMGKSEEYETVEFEIKISVAIIRNAINAIEYYNGNGMLGESVVAEHFDSIRKNSVKLDRITQELIDEVISSKFLASNQK